MPPKRKVAGVSDASATKSKQVKLDAFIKKTQPKEGEKPLTKTPLGDSLKDLITDSQWKEGLENEFNKEYFKKIENFVTKAYKSNQVFPPRELIFNALNSTPLSDIKVVILGQDPYHDDGQAHGLCFSVLRGVKSPPSLKNIYKELCEDIKGFKTPQHGYLQKWADNGILLLNATLTVEAHKANSHSKIGWQIFTDACIKLVNCQCDNVVFLLWGGFAQKKATLVDANKHKVIKTAHPSPLSCTKFFGCKCFSETNEALKKMGKQPVDWSNI